MGKRLCILAVDDNIISLATLEQELKDQYEVVTVNSGTRAIRFLKQRKPDLILLDVQMALKDGIETLKEIRGMENGAAIPVIMLTSKNDKETIIESSKLGALDYVLKPFNIEQLRERIQHNLKKVGAIPMDPSELYRDVREIQKGIRTGDVRLASAKMNDVLGFKLDEELGGRLRSAKAKLQEGDENTARRLISRVLKFLERNMSPEQAANLSFNGTEVSVKLSEVLDDLKDFKVKEASAKLEEVLCYDLPYELDEICETAQDRLREFDDGAAEELIQSALRTIKRFL